MATPTFSQLQSSPGNALAILVSGLNPDGTIATFPSLNTVQSSANTLTGSGTGAASAAIATLTSAAGRTAYITGFQVTGAGATGAIIVVVTVTGVANTMSYDVVVPAGVTTSISPLTVTFGQPVAASAVNTNIVVTVPSFGTGNTNTAVSAQGFLV